jgi:hypothetical protein
MDEYVLPTLALDEAKPLVVIEPLDGSANSFACHNNLTVKLAVRRRRSSVPRSWRSGYSLTANGGGGAAFDAQMGEIRRDSPFMLSRLVAREGH